MRTGDRLRRLIAREAARLMYEDGVREYRDAKRKAARRFGAESSLSLGSHLPSNAEIHAEVQHLIGTQEEDILPGRLMRLRLLALSQMELLKPFHPHLVGSVLSGTVTERSDIDLHLFADTPEQVEDFLGEMGVPFEQVVVTISRAGDFREYPHIYLDFEGIVIECTVYPVQDIRRIPKSSITGRPMERVDTKKLRKIIAAMAEDSLNGP